MTGRLGQWARYGLFMAYITVFIMGAAVSARAAPYAAMVMDARTGEILHETNANTRLHPASLTKMMTLYVAFQAIERGEISLDTEVTITAEASAEPPSKLGLRTGQRIRLRYLIRAAAVRSANDAATAIGIAIEGSEVAFARRMTRTAQAMGMTSTNFHNMHGLTQDGHMSTARDMTILGRHMIYDWPQYYNLFSRRTADAGMAQVNNTNIRFLDSYRGADGIKTGYTRAAGYNLVASAERGDRRIIATVFGGTSTANRNARVQELLNQGFATPSGGGLNRPTPPGYNGGDDPVAAALASNAGGAGAAGKTVRVSGLVTRSLRPNARPGASVEPQLATVSSDSIENLIAQALESESDSEAQATAEALAAALAAEMPEVIADPQLASDEGAAFAPSVTPESRPETLASGSDILTDAAEVAEAVAEAEALTVIADAAMGENSDPAAVALLAAALENTPEVAPDAGTLTVASAATEVAPPADPNRPVGLVSPDVVMAAAVVAPPPPVRDAEPEVVTRISTSGGRHWGITVGRFNTRHEAERVLLQVALNEMSALDGSRRLVNQSNRGFEANFMGLTQEGADLACRRLQARGTACAALTPN